MDSAVVRGPPLIPRLCFVLTHGLLDALHPLRRPIGAAVPPPISDLVVTPILGVGGVSAGLPAPPGGGPKNGGETE